MLQHFKPSSYAPYDTQRTLTFFFGTTFTYLTDVNSKNTTTVEFNPFLFQLFFVATRFVLSLGALTLLWATIVLQNEAPTRMIEFFLPSVGESKTKSRGQCNLMDLMELIRLQ